MADIVDRATRSRMMSKIRGQNTGPELRLRYALHSLGFRYRLHRKGLPGRPDLVFPKHKALVFVHGCFWHRHAGCRFAYFPASNVEFWREKFGRTLERDAAAIAQLKAQGWRVAVVWECRLESRDAPATALRVGRWLAGRRKWLEVD